MRVFICVELSDEARKEIARIIEKIEQTGLINAKYVEPENLHLTLKFLGEVEDSKIEEIKKQLNKIKFKKFKARLGSLGVFTPQYIKILWVELLGEEIYKLKQEVDKLLESLFPEEKGFSSHVTIARVKSLKDRRVFLDMIQKEKLTGEFEVSNIKLKSSTLTPEGPVYEDILEIKLD